MKTNRMWLTLFFLLSCTGCSPPPGGADGYKIAFVPARDGQYGIISMNSDTTGSKTLAEDRMAQLRFASWSPDGQKLAFYSGSAGDREIIEEYGVDNEYLLYLMDAAGGNQKRLLDFPILDFGWAPDSRRLFIISAHEAPDRDSPEVRNGTLRPLASVYVFDTQTGTLTRLPGTGRNCSAAWSPDGSRLAVGFGLGDYCGLHLISPDGARSERLTDGATIDFRPAWSPDGKALAYIAHAKPDDADAETGVCVTGIGGAGRKRLVNRTFSYVMWSPDGKQLLLQSSNMAYLIDPEGRKQVPLSAGAGLRNIVNAVFTPDGSKVMFCSNDSGEWKIYSLGREDHKRKTITLRTSSSNYCLSPLLTR